MNLADVEVGNDTIVSGGTAVKISLVADVELNLESGTSSLSHPNIPSYFHII